LHWQLLREALLSRETASRFPATLHDIPRRKTSVDEGSYAYNTHRG
jgi:hypothetical protein